VAVGLPKLQIVWRNPQPIRCRRRWERFQEASNSAQYIIQEFLSTGEHGFWSTTYQLRCFRGNGAASQEIRLVHRMRQ
jgi:hypothetical protein